MSEMRKFGLIGYPLGHSFSKGYFSEKFLKEHITGCSYENFPIPDIGLLPKLLADEPDLQGLNVTIPYKSEVFSYIDKLDPEASEIGAVNVLKIKRTGERVQLTGYNSDVTGISDSLLPHLHGNIKNAIVLGTGGSSRAVCYVLRKLGLNITQVSRSNRPGMINYSEITPEIIKEASLIVNTTPLGMFPATEHRPEIDYTLLNSNHILFDLVYNPEITLFLRSGIERGCTVVTGLKMLHSQAERAWQIWNDENM
jgi:shikimate dehydrogenase